MMPPDCEETVSKDLRVGFVGLGIMGRPMAGHILQAGYPLSVWNRTPTKADVLVAGGARLAADPATLAAECDVLLTIVTDAPDVEEVLFGDRGVLRAIEIGSRARMGTEPLTVIDMSTISPLAARRIAARLADEGISFLDAPVTGGDVGARSAALTFMVGGDAGVCERFRPLLGTMGKRIIHVGPHGAGQMVKACNQILCAVNLIAVCEALSLARKNDIDLQKMLDVVTSGAGGSWSLANLGPKIVAGDLNPAFMIRLIQKDLRAVMDSAAACDLPLPGTALAAQLFRAVEAIGGAELGTQAMIQAYERLGNFRLGEGADG